MPQYGAGTAGAMSWWWWLVLAAVVVAAAWWWYSAQNRAGAKETVGDPGGVNNKDQSGDTQRKR